MHRVATVSIVDPWNHGSRRRNVWQMFLRHEKLQTSLWWFGVFFLFFFPPWSLIVKDPAGGGDCAEY